MTDWQPVEDLHRDLQPVPTIGVTQTQIITRAAGLCCGDSSPPGRLLPKYAASIRAFAPRAVTGDAGHALDQHGHRLSALLQYYCARGPSWRVVSPLPLGAAIGGGAAESSISANLQPMLFYVFSVPKASGLPMFILVSGTRLSAEVAYPPSRHPSGAAYAKPPP